MVTGDREGGYFSIIRRLRAAAEPAAVPSDMNPGVSPDFFHLFTHWKPGSEDYDEFISQVQHTREYCFFTLAAMLQSEDQSREVVFCQIQECLSDLTSTKTKLLLEAVEAQVRANPVLLARAEMVVHILMTACWRLILNGGLFPIPLCGDISSLDSLKEQVDDASARVSAASPTPVLVDFCTSIFASARAALWHEHPEYVLTPRPKDRDLFGWTAGWPGDWKWGWLLETAEGGIRVRRNLQEKDLISFESYRDFFVKRGCQIIGAYSQTSNGYEYLSENGKEPSDHVDGDEPRYEWEWAKRRYQHDFGRNRPDELGYQRPPYYVTLSFSVPVDDVARPSQSRLAMSRDRSREGVHIYAVYSIFDLLHLPKGKVPAFSQITQALHRNIDDLRLIATRQLAREARAEEQSLYDQLFLEKQELDRLNKQLVEVREYARALSKLLKEDVLNLASKIFAITEAASVFDAREVSELFSDDTEPAPIYSGQYVKVMPSHDPTDDAGWLGVAISRLSAQKLPAELDTKEALLVCAVKGLNDLPESPTLRLLRHVADPKSNLASRLAQSRTPRQAASAFLRTMAYDPGRMGSPATLYSLAVRILMEMLNETATVVIDDAGKEVPVTADTLTSDFVRLDLPRFRRHLG